MNHNYRRQPDGLTPSKHGPKLMADYATAPQSFLNLDLADITSSIIIKSEKVFRWLFEAGVFNFFFSFFK